MSGPLCFWRSRRIPRRRYIQSHNASAPGQTPDCPETRWQTSSCCAAGWQDKGVNRLGGKPCIPERRRHPIPDFGLVAIHPFQADDPHQFRAFRRGSVHGPGVFDPFGCAHPVNVSLGGPRRIGVRQVRGHRRHALFAGVMRDQARIGRAQGAQNETVGRDGSVALRLVSPGPSTLSSSQIPNGRTPSRNGKRDRRLRRSPFVFSKP